VPSRLPGLRKTAVEEPLAGQDQPGPAKKRGGRIRAVPRRWVLQAFPVADVVAARRWYAARPWLPGRLFAALTQLPALLAVAWLLPGVAMLLAGRLLPSPMVIIFVPLAIALCYFAMRELPSQWPKLGPGAADPTSPPQGSKRPDVPLWSILCTIAVAAGYGVWQALEKSQQLVVARAPGGYLQYAYWIAHHGSAQIPVLANDFGLSPGTTLPGLSFASPGFLVHGAQLLPGYMAGLPLVLAGGIWARGVTGALLMGPLLGGCAILSVAGLAGRLAGPRWAPAAAVVLAVVLPEQYVSRTTLTQPLVQVLLFGGLCLVLDSLAVRRPPRGPRGPWGVRGPWGAESTGFTGGQLPWQAMTLAGFGGLALGLTVLADIGSVNLLLPLFPFLAIMFVARMPQAGPMAFGLLVGIGCGVAEGSRLARPYLSGLSTQLHDIGLAAAGFGLLTVLIAPLAFARVRAVLGKVVRWTLPVMGLSGVTRRVPIIAVVLEGLPVLLPVAALVGFAIRPLQQVTKGATNPYTIRYVAALQKLAGLPVDGRQQYYEQSLNWVIWYIGLPAVLLACIGAALVGRRCVRALLRWRGAAPGARLWGLPLMVFAWSTGTVLWDPAIFPDQPWASQRLVPVVLPGITCLAVWMCSRVRLRAVDLGASQVTGMVVAGCSVLAMGLPAAVTTFDPGYVKASAGTSKHLAARGMALQRTYAGSQYAVSRLCSAIGPSSSVVIVDKTTAALFTQVVRGMCDTPTARMDGASPASVEQVVTAIERTGRRPVLLGSTASSVDLIGAEPQRVLNLATLQDAHALTGPPAAPWPVTYTVWLASPSGT
jgi:hypothetical protein